MIQHSFNQTLQSFTTVYLSYVGERRVNSLPTYLREPIFVAIRLIFEGCALDQEHPKGKHVVFVAVFILDRFAIVNGPALFWREIDSFIVSVVKNDIEVGKFSIG